MSKVTSVKKRSHRQEAPYAAPAPVAQSMADEDAPAPAATPAKGKKAAAAKAAAPAAAPAVKAAKATKAATGKAAAAAAAAAPAMMGDVDDVELEAKAAAAELILGPLDLAEDPRPRHHEELRKMNALFDAIKKEREGYTKAYEQQLIRKKLTKKMRIIEETFRARCKSEVEQYLASLTPEQIKNDPYRICAMNHIAQRRWYDQLGKGRRFGAY